MSATPHRLSETAATHACTTTKRTEMRARVAQRNQIEGWGFSLILHGILLNAIVSAFRLLPAPIHPEPFRWNVTFLESSRQSTMIEPASNASVAKEILQTVTSDVHSSVSPTTGVLQLSQPPRSDANHTVGESNEARPATAAPPPTPIAQPQLGVSPQMPSTTETTSVTQETLPVQRDAAEQPNTIITTTPIPTELSAPS